MGRCAPPDAAPWACGRPRCRQPGSWSRAGRGWPLCLGWSIELEGIFLHSWPASPLSTACTLAWRKRGRSESQYRQTLVCGLFFEVMPWGKCVLDGHSIAFLGGVLRMKNSLVVMASVFNIELPKVSEYEPDNTNRVIHGLDSKLSHFSAVSLC